MSYREENGQVVLTMSREDFNELIGVCDGHYCFSGDSETAALINRLNEGNPNYLPYQLEKKK